MFFEVDELEEEEVLFLFMTTITRPTLSLSVKGGLLLLLSSAAGSLHLFTDEVLEFDSTVDHG